MSEEMSRIFFQISLNQHTIGSGNQPYLKAEEVLAAERLGAYRQDKVAPA